MNTKAIVAIGVVAILLVGGAAAAIIILANSGDDLPAKYDQREKGIVTPVKYQNPWGTCWSFGSTGAAETSVLTYLGKTAQQFKEENGYDLDFSEKHLAWFALNAVTAAETDTQVGEGFMLLNHSVYDYHYIYDNGGKATMAASLYSTGVGPVMEKDLFRYMGENGTTAFDYFTVGTANTIAYLNFFAYDKLNDNVSYAHYLETATIKQLSDLLATYRDWGVVLPDDFDAEYVKDHPVLAYDLLVERLGAYYMSSYSEKNEYAEMDSWEIPLGEPSQRNYSAGYTMINGNSLLPPQKVNSDDEWIGISDARMQLIKKELYAGHGMGMSYFYDSDTLNRETWAQFNSFKENGKAVGTTNHAIQVVGWDDNYSKDNFLEKPERDGAWLCKNSWGSETDYDTTTNIGKNAWGIKNADGKHTGYFWISYCDRSLNRFMSYEFGESPGEESFNAYVYDYLPSHREKTMKSEDVLKTANVFTIGEAKEKLNSVSIKTSYPGSDVKVSVYKLNDGFTNPTDGTVLWETSKNFELEGFHRLIVDKDIEMTEGQKIAVVVEEKNPYYEDGKTMYIADYNYGYDKDKAAEYDDSKKAIYTVTVVNPGESFILMDGKWSDWNTVWERFKTDDHDMVDNFRIKMFTTDVAVA